MRNKTAMQEFSEWLLAFEYELPLELQVKAKECLAMEKEQIIEAYVEGCGDSLLHELSDNTRAKDYYTQTYKQ